MSSLLVFNRIYRLEIQSVMLVFSTAPLTFSLAGSLCEYVYCIQVYSVRGGSMGS